MSTHTKRSTSRSNSRSNSKQSTSRSNSRSHSKRSNLPIAYSAEFAYGEAEPVYASMQVNGVTFKNRNRFQRLKHKTRKMLQFLKRQGAKKMYSQDMDLEFLENTCLRGHALMPSEAELLHRKYISQPDTFTNYINMYCKKKKLLIQ